VNPLDQSIKDLELILGLVECGSMDRPRRMTRIALTLKRIQEWHAVRGPSVDENRGGSSSPVEVEERQEDRRVALAAERDAKRVAALLGELSDMCHRYTTPVDHRKLPSELPGCVSCARKRQKGGVEIAGHFAPVADRYKGKQLCMWCGEHLAASGELPPLDVVDMFHRQGAQAAGRELAKRQRKQEKVA
jgi:hypothetical protein